MYWNINDILPYQRCFNFINGSRSIGKSYTTQKYVLNKCINNPDLEFVYILRTKNEKFSGTFGDAFKKVCDNEFRDFHFDFDNNAAYIIEDDDNAPKGRKKRILGYCIALSEAQEIKKHSYPKVKYLIFDEYVLDEELSGRYVNGWKEPDLLISIYHTIDREEDRVVCFMLANNLSFFNPYHMHPAFKIPSDYIKPGCIWYGENILFQWAVADLELENKKSKSKFIKMISSTDYAVSAVKGSYSEDINSFIGERGDKTRCMFCIIYSGFKFGVWYDYKEGLIYIDSVFDSGVSLVYALTLNDHTEGTVLSRGREYLIKWLSDLFKNGKVRFTSMEVKKVAEEAIRIIL